MTKIDIPPIIIGLTETEWAVVRRALEILRDVVPNVDGDSATDAVIFNILMKGPK